MVVVMSFSMHAAKTSQREEHSRLGQQKYFWHDPALINQEAPAPNTCHILAIIELSITLWEFQLKTESGYIIPKGGRNIFDVPHILTGNIIAGIFLIESDE